MIDNRDDSKDDRYSRGKTIFDTVKLVVGSIPTCDLLIIRRNFTGTSRLVDDRSTFGAFDIHERYRSLLSPILIVHVLTDIDSDLCPPMCSHSLLLLVCCSLRSVESMRLTVNKEADSSSGTAFWWIVKECPYYRHSRLVVRSPLERRIDFELAWKKSVSSKTYLNKLVICVPVCSFHSTLVLMAAVVSYSPTAGKTSR